MQDYLDAYRKTEAPNRYRKLFTEHPKTEEKAKEEFGEALLLQKQEFPLDAEFALGLELEWETWLPILVWEKK